MHYVGGKYRQRKHFVPAILGHTTARGTYYEPFVGGGSMLERMAPNFQIVIASDTHAELIDMWRAAVAGWVPPTEVSGQEFAELRAEHYPVRLLNESPGVPPTAIRGFVGFGCAYGGKWFSSYARSSDNRNYAEVSSRRVVQCIEKMPPATTFVCCDYSMLNPGPGDVVYCDPPYANVGVQFRTQEAFDTNRFWRTMDRWVEAGAHVYVSEYQAPNGWEPLVHSVQMRNIDIASKATRTQDDILWVPTRYRTGYPDPTN